MLVIDVNKLGDKDGDKTVGIRGFERGNLLLVDEGHRGTSGETWLRYRKILADGGFSFEYSATFGQAVATKSKAATKTSKKGVPSPIYQEYAKSILFDYSYKFFHGDDYGKEHLILNLPKDSANATHKYFVACLLMFFQQCYVFAKDRQSAEIWNIAKPLWVFVGHTVNAKAGKSDTRDQKTEKSDIAMILHHLQYFLSEREQVSV